MPLFLLLKKVKTTVTVFLSLLLLIPEFTSLDDAATTQVIYSASSFLKPVLLRK
jgi:hypothetical protein